jgi:NAD(P)H dehydrogenase (quinone)
MKILIIYYSRHGSIKAAARMVAEGVEKIEGAQAILRTVPEISTGLEKKSHPIPEAGDLYIDNKELAQCDGVIVGSPGYFGNMASPLKYWLETTSGDWMKGSLINKPAGFFTGTSSLHGGQESTLLSMMIPFFHHGAVMVGLPYSNPAVGNTRSGGTPYGATHFGGSDQRAIDTDERSLFVALGERIATVAKKLKAA